MIVTEDNFEVYAFKHYQNAFCISQEEFEEDLRQLKTIRRMITNFVNGNETNLRLLVNNFIIFYNCFEHHAASSMIELKIDVSQSGYYNAVLKFLSLPLINPKCVVDVRFYELLEVEFS